MKINVITNIEAFKALKEDWDILFSKSNCTVFQSFDFNYYSWKHELISDNRNQLAIAVITINESIVAIFPFYIDSNKQLRFINDVHFDFCDFITQESINFSAVFLYLKQEINFKSIILINVKQEANIYKAISELNTKYPPTGRTIEENIKIDDLRRSYSFRSSNDTSVQIWKSDSNTDWTVVYEEDPQFAASPLGRFVFVKPLPKSLNDALNINKEHLSTIALYPFSIKRAETLSLCGATRICPLGSSQDPSIFWHHDGLQTLAPLVHWTDAG